MTIVHLYPNFDNIGGAQSMVLTLYKGMKARSKSVKIAGLTSFNDINERYKKDLPKSDYIQIKLFKTTVLKNKILISHHRKLTSYLVVISKIFFLKLQITHVAHNEFYSLKNFTFFPKSIIAVSNKVKSNLVTVFNVDSNRIKVIYNGIENKKDNIKISSLDEPIKILYPARVNAVKKQLELVEAIKKADIKNIKISFCGDGDLLKQLKLATINDDRFDVKGLVDNMELEFNDAHFTMLFTEREGLPVSLIESCKYGVPIICNDVGGNLEIVENEVNGYVVNTYKELVTVIKKIQKLHTYDYKILCVKSKEIFNDNFTQSKMIDAYLSNINEQN